MLSVVRQTTAMAMAVTALISARRQQQKQRQQRQQRQTAAAAGPTTQWSAESEALLKAGLQTTLPPMIIICAIGG